MKILETKQGKIEIYPFIAADKPQSEARGLETTALVLTPEQFDDLLIEIFHYRMRKLSNISINI